MTISGSIPATTQWTKSSASESVTTSASSAVPVGTATHESGGEMSCPLQVYCSWIGVVSPNGVASWNVAFGSSVDVVTMLAVWSGLAGAKVRPSCEHAVIAHAAATAKVINERGRTRDESGSRAPPTEGTYGGDVPYEPTLESLRAHPVPPWFADAKFGIFIHWGVFSIPAWAPTTGGMFDQPDPFRNTPYTEWYLNSLALDGSPVQAHHRETYGEGYSYDDVRAAVEGGNRAVGTRRSGPISSRRPARGTSCWSRSITTASCSGRARIPNPFKDGWHSERDLVGELGEAVRARGLTYGLYYSGGLDWTFGGLGIDSMRSLVAAIPQSEEYGRYADAHWRELIERYNPAVLWNDIGYPIAGNSPQLFADYYNAHPEGVVNNRFDFMGVAGGTAHADFTTPEYAQMDDITADKWEACRGIGHSFGLNRNAADDDLLTVDALVHLLADIVSKNGNLLLNVGPAADGRIPHAQAERLLGLGWWLTVNGEAIFDTTPWTRAVGTTAEGLDVRFTRADGAVYAIVLGRPPTRTLTIRDLPVAGEGSRCWATTRRSSGGTVAMIRGHAARGADRHSRGWHCVSAASRYRGLGGRAALPTHHPRASRRRGVEGRADGRPLPRRGCAHRARLLHRR